MSAPKWAVGMRKLGVGIYIDPRDNSMHFDCDEICAHFGVPPTRENLDGAQQAALDALRDLYPEVTWEQSDEDDTFREIEA